ncbi:acyltransferase family protein [Lignipirellula cremea]|uniref:Acyltransferase family protein n=1 Tax=Lignipirellula cremea TaxID=2528010 RepID=A0A518DWG5_9BACT|nr:acyltransferase [Lignipirellula cremea]QDU96180.1 Acyltransferase family protein [Lignipirellula cremea]
MDLDRPIARYQMLDVWRGLACLSIIVCHSIFYCMPGTTEGDGIWELLLWLCSKAWIGVPAFFVISGYCIAASADAPRRRTEPAKNFAWRRMLRIYPPLWAYLVLTAVAVMLMEYWWTGIYSDHNYQLRTPDQLTLWQWLGNFTLTESWRYHLLGSAQEFYGGQLWTLCYEEQFYLLVAALMTFCRGRTLFAALAGVTALVAVAGVFSPMSYLQVQGFFFDGAWLQFAAGVAVYFALHRANRLEYWGIVSLLAIALAWQFVGPSSVMYSPRPGMRILAFGFALLLLVMHRFDARLAALPVMKPIAWVGVMCYSIYLIHWPVVKPISHIFFEEGWSTPAETVLVVVPVCLAASLAAGWLFYHTIEKRFIGSRSAPAPTKAPEETNFPTPSTPQPSLGA